MSTTNANCRTHKRSRCTRIKLSFPGNYVAFYSAEVGPCYEHFSRQGSHTCTPQTNCEKAKHRRNLPQLSRSVSLRD